MAHEEMAAGHHEEHPPTTIRQYIVIGVILAIITAVELALTEAMDLEFRLLVTLLILLSAVKFAIVVALFMHLRFDHKLFTRLFVFGLVLASALLVALLALFNTDDSGRHGVAGIPGAAMPAAAAPGGHGASVDSPTDEGDGMVAGREAHEFFAANCAACHGQNREGLVGPALTPSILTQADEVYADVIKNGRPGTAMPPWGGMMSDADINTLVHFLKTVEP